MDMVNGDREPPVGGSMGIATRRTKRHPNNHVLHPPANIDTSPSSAVSVSSRMPRSPTHGTIPRSPTYIAYKPPLEPDTTGGAGKLESRGRKDRSLRSEGTNGAHPPSPLLGASSERLQPEESRLQSGNISPSLTPTGRLTPEVPSPTETAFRGRPRRLSNASLQQRSRSRPLRKSPGPVTLQKDSSSATQLTSPLSRDRGASTSSQHSLPIPHPLRSMASVPDYGSVRTPRRPLLNWRSERGPSPRNSNHFSLRREPLLWQDGRNNDEVRSSLRSAMTTASSYLETSGTERSSVLTRSSSTSDFANEEPEIRDEGMSVDDAIGMYADGFTDDWSSHGEDTTPQDGVPIDDRQPTQEPTQTIESTTALAGASNCSNSTEKPAKAPIIDKPPGHDIGRQPATEAAAPPPPPPSPLSPAMKHAPTKEPAKVGFPAAIPKEPRDRYGFKKATQYVTLAQYNAWEGGYLAHLERRKSKWTTFLKESGLSTDNPTRFPAKSNKVKRFIRKGIPPEWRGAAWFWYAGGYKLMQKNAGLYRRLMEAAETGQMSEGDKELIERDLHRTFPDNIRFKPDSTSADDLDVPKDEEPETPILKSLRRVLHAFSIQNPKIGYCQSLNFLAGLLLLFMEEEKAFWMMQIITQIYLPGTHEVNLEGANVDLGVLMISIKESMPTIWTKVGGELDGTAGSGRTSTRLPPITLCTTAWFMSCFIGTLPIETTLRVWDSFFYEGSKTLFRIALAIFKVGEPEIRAVNDPMEIFQVVQTIPRRLIDANALMEACFRRRNGFGHLSQETIEQRRKERRALYAEERAKLSAKSSAVRPKTRNNADDGSSAFKDRSKSTLRRIHLRR
ncbi:MAG: hypothetical protein M1819_004551 [Sarea resinae]|nr:MAG: hypothetical protein M1819_004551 [Sarea resinae]